MAYNIYSFILNTRCPILSSVFLQSPTDVIIIIICNTIISFFNPRGGEGSSYSSGIMSLKSVSENVNCELFFLLFCRPYSLPSKKKASLMVEMIITHQENSRGKILEKLKQAYANPNLSLMFDPAHFETLHTCEWVSDNIYDSLILFYA